jgi:hypothetical protein
MEFLAAFVSTHTRSAVINTGASHQQASLHAPRPLLARPRWEGALDGRLLGTVRRKR